ncbi:MAG: SpoIIE family protein phosphatase [Oscillospiraceae bacterium]
MSLYIETGWGSLNKHNEELCGDKVETIKKGDDTFMVLADGLGSGVKANILASLTSKIVITMLSEGADVSDVIETMTSTLPVCKERLVAYSTFSFIHIKGDGEAHLVEFDNPDTIILRDGKSMFLPREEYTISGKTIRETHIKLQPNDFCISFSDGVIHAGVGQLLNLGWEHHNVVDYLEKNYRSDATAFDEQNQLLQACNSLYMESPGDDTTVAVCKVRTPNVAFIMVGPPICSGDDELIVNELLKFDGTKVVCGGTTSQIVSKISGRELKIMLNYITPDVPPIGKIDGIDLVTEGVITLGKTYDILSRYENGGVGRDNALNSRNDGASLLAQTLINRCTGAKFVVGRALNPAHQNPDLPISLNLKLRLVNDIADCLKRLGKSVEVRFY